MYYSDLYATPEEAKPQEDTHPTGQQGSDPQYDVCKVINVLENHIVTPLVAKPFFLT